jgi:hypothetical protein
VRASRLFLGTAAIHPFLFLLHKTRISVYSCPHPTLGYDTRRVGPEWKRNPTSAGFASDALLPSAAPEAETDAPPESTVLPPLLRARCYATLVQLSRLELEQDKLDCCFLRGATRRRLRVLLVRPRHGPETVTPCAHVGPAPQKFQRLQAALQKDPYRIYKIYLCAKVARRARYCGVVPPCQRCLACRK